jgi:hypothetical protein
MLFSMAVIAPEPVRRSRIPSWLRHLVVKFGALTAIAIVLGLAQGWVGAKYYGPDWRAGFHTGVIEGALMPAAFPALLLGKDVPIYAENNEGRPYKIGYILGINLCGTIFFGVAMYRGKKSSG